MFQEKPKNWRLGQTIFNFLRWLNEEKDYGTYQSDSQMADPFNIPDNELEELYQEFLNKYHIKSGGDKFTEKLAKIMDEYDLKIEDLPYPAIIADKSKEDILQLIERIAIDRENLERTAERKKEE